MRLDNVVVPPRAATMASISASRAVGIRAETVSTRCSRSMGDLFRAGGYGARPPESSRPGIKKPHRSAASRQGVGDEDKGAGVGYGPRPGQCALVEVHTGIAEKTPQRCAVAASEPSRAGERGRVEGADQERRQSPTQRAGFFAFFRVGIERGADPDRLNPVHGAHDWAVWVGI